LADYYQLISERSNNESNQIIINQLSDYLTSQ
jgi:hypothetical protein